MLIIQQGDQYMLLFKIKKDGVYITPSNVQDVRIQIGAVLKTYSKSELTFDTVSSEWRYPLTQKETIAIEDNYADIQIGVKETNQISYSPTIQAYIGKSIINKEW